jgi:predicted HTH transcriptional regulator
LFKRHESKTLEFKRDLSSPDGVLRTLVAFSNTAGGILLVGVEDASHRVRGVPDPMDAEERLANLVSDNILPRLVPDIEILPWRDRHVLAVQVYPSGSRPHHLRREGPDAGVYVRVGSANRRADRDLIEQLRLFSRGESIDERAIPDLDSEAIDFRAASESFAPFRKLKRSDMETLRLVTTHQGRKVPTIGGLLLFGKERTQRFPDAWIQVGRFRGTDKAHLFDHAEIRSYLPTAVVDAMAFVEKHSIHGISIDAPRRTERWTLPPIAVREAVINAVAHADYSQSGAPIRISIFDDRLEVENPGLLPFGLTVDDLREGVSKLRNRVIGRVFHDLGLIEQWGSGIQRMTAACHESGLEPPSLMEHGIRFRVTLKMARTDPVSADPIDRQILSALSDGKGHSTRDIAAVIGRSLRATRTRLVRLVAVVKFREIGTGPTDPKRRYFLAGVQ